MNPANFECIRELTPRSGGLTSTEVDLQRSRYGSNNIVEERSHPLLALVRETLTDPMIWLLVGISLLFLLAGQKTDSLALALALLPLMLMDAFLHWRTESSTALLHGKLQSRVWVLRDGKKIEIDSRALVPGDFVYLASQQLLPADGVFEKTEDLQIDESALTGESFPVTKKPLNKSPFQVSSAISSVASNKLSRDCFGFAGTRVLKGLAHLRVLSTGNKTLYGEIVQSVAGMPQERTPLQKSITRIVQILIYGALIFCVLLSVIRRLQGHDWLDAILSAATLALAAIPEEFPVVFSFFLGVGVYRLAKRKALVRRAVSIENLGRVRQICTDKTGTLTEGKLSLTHVLSSRGFSEEDLLESARAACSSAEDPLDLAILESPLFVLQLPSEKKKIHHFPFTEDRKRETALVQSSEAWIFAHTKGAPETILSLSELSSDQVEFWKNRVSEWARQGCKVIAVARKKIAFDKEASRLQEPEAGMEFVGLMAFEDPPRPEIPSAMAYCRQNSIGVLMITGDHPVTAMAIAQQVGLSDGTNAELLSAEEEPEKLEDEFLSKNPNFLRQLKVVARCTPLQKLKIVSWLKKSGEIVAVTGDGVNDVPALKAADIGIAMGERGTRSAKEVSSIVLADDNFQSIVSAIQEGRQLFLNLKMSFGYLLMIHIPLVLSAALLPSLGYPLLFLPIHILWFEMIAHPTALLAFQMRSSSARSRVNSYSLFSKRDLWIYISSSLLAAVLMCWIFVSDFEPELGASNLTLARSQSMAFLILWCSLLNLFFTGLRHRMGLFISLLIASVSILLLQASSRLAFLHLTPLNLEHWTQVFLALFASFGFYSILSGTNFFPSKSESSNKL